MLCTPLCVATFVVVAFIIIMMIIVVVVVVVVFSVADNDPYVSNSTWSIIKAFN